MKNKNDMMIKSFVLLLVFILGLVGYVCYYRGVFGNTNTNNEEVAEEKNPTQEHLEKFINAASIYSDTGYSSTAQAFYNGTTSIDNDIKYKITFNVLYYIDKNYKSDITLTNEEINSMQRVIGGDITGELLDVIKISDFNKIYKDLFHEKPNYTIDTIKNISCPSPLGFNNELDRIYLFYRCEGNSYSEYDSNIVSFDEDDNYYYVHQEGSLKPNAEESDVIVYKVLWKFDKNLNFVSTSRE